MKYQQKAWCVKNFDGPADLALRSPLSLLSIRRVRTGVCVCVLPMRRSDLLRGAGGLLAQTYVQQLEQKDSMGAPVGYVASICRARTQFPLMYF